VDDRNELERLLETVRGPCAVGREALRARRAAVRRLGEIGAGNPDVVFHLIRILRTDPDLETRLEAASALGTVGRSCPTREIEAALRWAVSQKTAPLRTAAAEALADVCGRRAVPQLLAVFREDRRPRVRACLADIVGGLKDPRAVPVLARALREHDPIDAADLEAYHAVADALGSIGTPEAVRALFDALLEEDVPDGYDHLVDVLTRTVPAAAFPDDLKGLRTDDPDLRRRRLAAELFFRDVPPARIAEVLGVRPAVLGRWRRADRWDDELRVRFEARKQLPPAHAAVVELAWVRAAAGAPERFRSPEAVRALIEAFRRGRERTVRRGAAWALGQIGDPEAVPALAEALRNDGDSAVREAAAVALGRIGNPEAVPELAEALRTDSSAPVRWEAARALGRIRSPEAVPALTQALRADGDPFVRQASAEALGRIGSPEAVQALTEVLREDKDPSVRWTTARALGEIRDPRTVPDLLEALQDRDHWIRRAAASALGVIGSPEAVPALAGALRTDRNPDVRKTAAVALGNIRTPEAGQALSEALRTDRARRVRLAAARALGDIGRPEAQTALAEAFLADPDPRVRSAAAEALAKIRQARTEPPENAEPGPGFGCGPEPGFELGFGPGPDPTA